MRKEYGCVRVMVQKSEDERKELSKKMRNSALKLGENHWVNRVNPWKVRAKSKYGI